MLRPSSPTILVAPGCFKEGPTSLEVGEAIARGLTRAVPELGVRLLPMSDGGEGFVPMLAQAAGGRQEAVPAMGPRGAITTARVLWLDSGGQRTAAFSIADVAGLRLVPARDRDPALASSGGVGEVIEGVIARGAQHVLVGCGDSGTIDGGRGLAEHLGARFLDRRGRPLPPGPLELRALHRIDTAGLSPAIRSTPITVACSRRTGLIGPDGTVAVYGIQKGMLEDQREAFEQALARLVECVRRDLGVDLEHIHGAGAAGGIAGALHAFAGATLRQRFEVIFQYVDLDGALAGAGLVITGEGSLDWQTPREKLPFEVSKRARAAGVPVLALVGQLGRDGADVARRHFDGVFPIVSRPTSLEQSIASTLSELERCAESLARLLLATGYLASAGPNA